jgi:hypothetical protein
MPEFFQTVMGHRFYEGQLPRLIKALERIADCLEKNNEKSQRAGGEDRLSTMSVDCIHASTSSNNEGD